MDEQRLGGIIELVERELRKDLAEVLKRMSAAQRAA